VKRFFFEKKKQKTFAPVAPTTIFAIGHHPWRERGCKSFLVLFFKKEPLPSYLNKTTAFKTVI
jgi:hypothetical protein